MLRMLFAAVLFLPFTSGLAVAFSGPGADKPCADCHTLSIEEAGNLLGRVVEKVVGVSPSGVPGLWVVDYENRGRKGPLYVDYSKKHVFSGNLFRLDTMENLTQRHAMETYRIDVSQIPLGDAIVVGNAEAKNRIIVFDDPECPFCAKLQPEMHKVVAERPDVAFFIKLYPLPMHPGAKEKAKAIICAKSLQMLDDSLTGKPIPPPTCETDQVEENLKLVERLGISSTPTLVFPDGRTAPGYRSAEKILELLGPAAAADR